MTATNCLDLKERGNALYAQHKYTEALQAYDDALSTLPEAGSSELRTTILANRAACHLALKQWDACVQVRRVGRRGGDRETHPCSHDLPPISLGHQRGPDC